jgi:arylsulfatase A-like enzyme
MKRRLASVLAALAVLLAAATQAAEKPNILVILADDLGYADLSPFGPGRYETPNLERMAREGRKYTSFYVASSVCTPSRAALLTGCYPARIDLMHNDLEMDSNNHGVLFPGDRKGLNPDEVTIAEMLKERGYATACIGKWHLGDQPEFLPARQGFDEFFGVPTSAGMPFPLPLLRGEKRIREMERKDLDLMTRQFTEEAVDFIERQAGGPFFIYLPHTMVHGPHHVSPEFRGKTGKGLYADGVAEVDWSVGQILNKLKQLKIEKETLVLFLSDNGGPLFEPMKVKFSSNAPFNGGKANVSEGGFRTPAIAWWPETIPAGSVTGLMASTLDLLPAFATLTGKPHQPPFPIDGVDISALFRGPLPAESPRKTLAYYAFHTEPRPSPERTRLHAVRECQWKYYLIAGEFLNAASHEYMKVDEGALFDLEADPGETTNVAGSHPEVVGRMKTLADEFRRELGDRGQPGAGVRKAGWVDAREEP